MDKRDAYRKLVAARKQCRLCCKANGESVGCLVNPADREYEHFDTQHIGPWTQWQGNLDAQVMIVGQDWGGTPYYNDNKGREKPGNPTNETLIQVLDGIGIKIDPPNSNNGVGQVFLTNAILCLKQGGLQGPVLRGWFENCGERFLKPTIDIVHPRVVVTLGEYAFRAMQRLYGLKVGRFRDVVENPEGVLLSNDIRLFPMYHCGARILNTHRKIKAQIEDWKRVGRYLETVTSR